MNRDMTGGRNDEALLAEARRVLGKFALVKPSISAGGVAAALQTASGRIYTGICLDLACGIGFCAEHSAIAADGVLAPCGRCRELIVQVDRRNLDCEVILPGGTSSKMADLLPRAWLEPLFARE
jgi:cytidine deaminase